MKKLILFIAIIAQGAMLTAQDTLIYGNLLQTTYDSGAFILIDKPAYAETRYSSCATIAPKISYLDEETSTLNKDLIFLRITDGSTEEKAKLSLVDPDILSYPTVGASNEVEWIAVYDSYDSDRDEKVSFTNFISYVTSNANFINSINSKIDSRVTETYILNLLADSVKNQALTDGVTTYGYLYLYHIGQMVTGQIEANASGTANVTNYTIPEALRPTFTTTAVASVNAVQFNNDGTILIQFVVANQNVSFSYTTF